MKFNSHHYQQVQEAYVILGKTQVHVLVYMYCDMLPIHVHVFK